ncbi:hypothetical protein BZA77DRAFT_158808 [Pyronema omphalodes]|nr:hypothetical protein BZA77DRAFT_158808 [Pyronema omphalodes]
MTSFETPLRYQDPRMEMKPRLLVYRFIEELRDSSGQSIFVHTDYNERNEVIKKFCEIPCYLEETDDRQSLSKYPFVVRKFVGFDDEHKINVTFNDTSLHEYIASDHLDNCGDNGQLVSHSSPRLDGTQLWEIARFKWGFLVRPEKMSNMLRLFVLGFLQNIDIVSGPYLAAGLVADFVSLAFLRALAVPNTGFPLIGFTLDSSETLGSIRPNRSMLQNLFGLLFQIPKTSSYARGRELIRIGKQFGLKRFKWAEPGQNIAPWDIRPVHNTPSSGIIHEIPDEVIDHDQYLDSVANVSPIVPETLWTEPTESLIEVDLLPATPMDLDICTISSPISDCTSKLSECNMDGTTTGWYPVDNYTTSPILVDDVVVPWTFDSSGLLMTQLAYPNNDIVLEELSPNSSAQDENILSPQLLP